MTGHSYLSPKCEVQKGSEIHRQGVFAKENIKKGELIALWGGYSMSTKEVEELPKKVLDFGYPVQVLDNFYIGPKKTSELDDAEMFNHSCDPNAGVKGQIVLVARKNIESGEEICFDYETTDTIELEFNCECGSKNCRGKIDGSSWKNPEFQRKNRDYFSWYILEKIKRLKKV